VLRRRRTTVLLVHGFDGFAAKDCRGELLHLTARLGPRAQIVGYYAADVDPDVWLPGEPATTQTSLVDLGARLAGLITSHASPVDVVGHSMGGLIIAAALAHVAPGSVRRTVMAGVPFAGLPSAVGTDVTQCLEMSPGSPFLTTLRPSADLLIASEADEAVPVASALACPAAQVWRIPATDAVHHGDLIIAPQVLKRMTDALS
jgi:pimeloyl-ACP methyl ester carboxylesterase